ncbi:DUF3105 domain-containing protein [Nocardioides sp. zg-1308]|uniref:DUF3105 domain-containing protein n=1 Tax=Nocardioides TaxID=1839 RepID=UPI00155432BC|nr:DUF3105 domain-containing protein [Nocardioides sp. S-34]NPD05532.1 DUF3105 domain-containing protein [Nocardioides sp. zg-1308]WQQ23418.1 DUF3105 domain-containing protein [Nocardioides sp. S-34]
MAKKAKTDRQAVIDSIRSQQSRSENRRGMAIVGICVLVAVVIVGAAAFKPVKDWYDLRAYSSASLSEIGAEASVCKKVTTKPAEGNQDHVDVGTPMSYPDAPPAFGTHWNMWDTIDRKLYTASDRPDLGELVHNLEHGYTILWYDETVADSSEQMDQLRAIASKLDSTTNLRDKFKAVPWTSEDGKAFPKGQHVAFTHWSVGGVGETDPTKQVGVWQYCSDVSGAALDTFLQDYPYMDSSEPTVL